MPGNGQERANNMAKLKKRQDGRLCRTFRYNGKKHFVYGHTVQELAQAEYDLRTKLEKGTEDRENPTLNEYYKRFTDNRRSKVKESTIRCQAYQFKNCADIPVDNTGLKLGEMRIQDIKPYDIQTVQAGLEKTDRTTETVNNCMAHLSHVFNAAVRDETIDRNPCKCIERVKRTEKPARDTIHRALSEKETQAFFEAAKGSYYENMFKLMIQTGIRVGEMAAISLFDVDDKKMMLHINKTVTRDEIGAYGVGSTPKTDAGNRDIPLTDQALKSIEAQKTLNKQIFGNVSYSTIFRSAEGALLREYQVNREIKRICKKIGIEKFTCHALRATFATRFIEQRPQDYKVLSEILGHSNIKITLNLYTHVMKESKVAAMQAVKFAI